MRNHLNKLLKISLKERLASADRFLLQTIWLGNGRLKGILYANGDNICCNYLGKHTIKQILIQNFLTRTETVRVIFYTVFAAVKKHKKKERL